jgi:Rieske Fe-S protein
MSLTTPSTPATDEPVTDQVGEGGPRTSRRQVLITGGVVAAAAAVTAACGSSSSASSPAATSAAPATSDTASGGSSAAAGGKSVKTTDVPVGGGTILTDAKVVVTQPTAGVFKAFTAVCTHQGCIVASVANGTINCPCHGSQYSVTDGSVKGGPAPAPLAAVPVTVSGDTITLS